MRNIPVVYPLRGWHKRRRAIHSTQKFVEMSAQRYIVAVFVCVHLTQPTVARSTVDAVAIKCGDNEVCDGKVDYCDRLTDECVPCWKPCSRETRADMNLCRTRCAGKLSVVGWVSRMFIVCSGCSARLGDIAQKGFG